MTWILIPVQFLEAEESGRLWESMPLRLISRSDPEPSLRHRKFIHGAGLTSFLNALGS